jgi:hypothetical protein
MVNLRNFAHTRKTKYKTMRTKTLLLTAALSAVGLSTSMAQSVFSVNAVGFVTVDVPKGLSMIANPLKAPTNTIAALFASAADGTTIYKYNAVTAQFTINTFDTGEWGLPNDTLVPGEGAFIRNSSAALFQITFVGEVSQSVTPPLSHDVPKGLSIQSSEVPQSGKVVADLGFPASDGDTIYIYDNASAAYVIHTLDTGEWSSGEPVPKVGESFFVKKVDTKAWTRAFTVNTP